MAQMKLRVRNYSRGCRVMVPRKNDVLGTVSVIVLPFFSNQGVGLLTFTIKESERNVK